MLVRSEFMSQLGDYPLSRLSLPIAAFSTTQLVLLIRVSALCAYYRLCLKTFKNKQNNLTRRT